MRATFPVALLVILICAIGAPGRSTGQDGLPDVPLDVPLDVPPDAPLDALPDSLSNALAPGQNPAIHLGESLTYVVKWGVIPAGKATLSVTSRTSFEGHPCYKVVSTAVSNSVFDKVYPVRDRFVSCMDVTTLATWYSEKHQREGKYRRDQVVRMDHKAGRAYYHDGQSFEITPGSFDVFAAFYYARTLPFEEGREFFLDSHSDKKNYPLKVKVLGRESVETPAGKFDCWVIQPTLRSGAFFKKEGRLKIWLTDDERRIPVQIRSKIPVGSISVVLVEYDRPERPERPERTDEPTLDVANPTEG